MKKLIFTTKDVDDRTFYYFQKYSKSFYWRRNILKPDYLMTPRQWINSSPTEHPLKKAFFLYLLNIKID